MSYVDPVVVFMRNGNIVYAFPFYLLAFKHFCIVLNDSQTSSIILNFPEFLVQMARVLSCIYVVQTSLYC